MLVGEFVAASHSEPPEAGLVDAASHSHYMLFSGTARNCSGLLLASVYSCRVRVDAGGRVVPSVNMRGSGALMKTARAGVSAAATRGLPLTAACCVLFRSVP